MERNYEEEARLLIQAVLQEQTSAYKSVDNATKEYSEQNPEAAVSKKLVPAEQFPPFLALIQEADRLKQKFGKKLFTLILEAGYCTRVEDSMEMLLPKYRWSNNTKQIYKSLVKKVAELLKQGKLKPLPK